MQIVLLKKQMFPVMQMFSRGMNNFVWEILPNVSWPILKIRQQQALQFSFLPNWTLHGNRNTFLSPVLSNTAMIL